MLPSVLSGFAIATISNASKPSAECNTEPPFSLKVVQEINALSALPSLVNTSQLLAGIDPTALTAFLSNSINTKNSQPNPIAHTFPNLTTGTINASTVVLPIDYDLARSIVPSKYGILKNSINTILPGFPDDKYPLVLSTQVDHDIQSYGIGIPDFSSAQFRFPFIDLLHDGYSTFTYIPEIFSSDNPIAIAGSEAYFEGTILATFDPPKDPYAFVPGAKDGQTYFNVHKLTSPLSAPVLNTTFTPQAGRYGEIGDYPLAFYTNITNQPTFGCANATCLLTGDNMIRFFHTNLTATALGIAGSVSLAPSAESGVRIFPRGGKWTHVRGLRADTAFVENNYRDCERFRGYRYLGV